MATNTDKIFFSILIGIVIISIFFTKPPKIPNIESFNVNIEEFAGTATDVTISKAAAANAAAVSKAAAAKAVTDTIVSSPDGLITGQITSITNANYQIVNSVPTRDCSIYYTNYTDLCDKGYYARTINQNLHELNTLKNKTDKTNSDTIKISNLENRYLY